MSLTLQDIYTANVRTISPDSTLADVRTIFNKLQIHHLPVVDRNELVGIISDRDLIKAVSPYAGTVAETTRDAATLKKRVHQVMTRRPITVHLAESIAIGAQRMLDAGVSSLPVLDEKNYFRGIVTWKDFVALLTEKNDS